MMIVFFSYLNKHGIKTKGHTLIAHSKTNINTIKRNVRRGYTPSGKHKLKSWNVRFFTLTEIMKERKNETI